MLGDGAVPDLLGGSGADPFAVLAHRWRLAEQRLYPSALTDPEAYQCYVVAVRALADELASVGTTAELAAAYDRAIPQAAAAIRAAGGADTSSAAELVAGAAFALRQGELAATQAATERAGRIADAARSGLPWVLVAERGSDAGAQFGNYRRLEMHLPEGTGVYAYAERQVDQAAPLFALERLRLDPASGAALGPPLEHWTFADEDAWRAAIRRLRAAVDRPGAASLDSLIQPG